MEAIFDSFLALHRHAQRAAAALGVTRRQPWAAPKRRTDGADRGAGMWGQQYARWSLSGCAWRPACYYEDQPLREAAPVQLRYDTEAVEGRLPR